MTRALLAAALLAAATALTAPASAQDARLVERLYDPAQVVQIDGRTNVQTTIRFGEDERIENVAIGDSQAWQVTPNKRANLLFVKPLAQRASTNMTVVTDRHTYLFDLVASPANSKPVYVLSFTYTKSLEDVQQAGLDEGPGAPTALEIAAATDPYAVADPAAINRLWTSSGQGGLLPADVYDDGDATFLTWPAGTALPAILIKDHEGTEGPVNYAVRGDTIVVEGVPREIVLRSGSDTAMLRNDGPVRTSRPLIAARAGAPDTTETK